MSLPKVSYGNYNYGQYANPTPVRYKGGLGEGLAGAAVSISSALQIKKEKEKQKLDAANTTSAIAEQKYQAALNENIGKARLQNQKWVIEQKEGYGNAVRDYKLGKIDRDTYLEKMDYYNTLLANLGTFKEQITTISKMNDGQDIDLSLLRSNPEAYRAEMHRRSLRDGNVFITTGENGQVMLDVGTWSKDLGKEDSRINVTLQQAVSDPRFYTPELSYNQDLNKNFATEVLRLKELSQGKGLHMAIVEDGRDIVKFDSSKQNEIIEFVKNNARLDGVLIGNDRKKYYEDNMGNGFGTWKNTEEQNNLVDQALATSMTEGLMLQTISNTKHIDPKTVNETRAAEIRRLALANAETYKAGADALAAFISNNLSEKNGVKFMTTKQMQLTMQEALKAGLVFSPIGDPENGYVGFNVVPQNKLFNPGAAPLILDGYDERFAKVIFKNQAGLVVGGEPLTADLDPQ
tara:strand:- start:1059 stop:2444 length:1386 start_codon:yes stop_codon:yes gene_type:complete